VPSQTDTDAPLRQLRQELSCHGSCLTLWQTRLKITMNLSSYLQMPPAPLVPNNTSKALPQGTSSGVSPSSGSNLGFDFADVMARQLQRLVPRQRQILAAEAPQPAEPQARTPDSGPVEAPPRVTNDADKRVSGEARQTQSDQSNTDDSTDSPASQHTRERAKSPTPKTQNTDVDALLAGLMQGAPVAPATMPQSQAETSLVVATPALTATQAPASTALTNTAALQTVELSPQMRIITDPQKAPSPESLAAFAKSMGLDESAIQNLLAQQPATPATVLAGTANNASAELATGVLPLTLPQAANGLQATVGTSLNGSILGQTSTATVDTAVAAQLAAMNASSQQPAAVSGAGLAAAATTLIAPTIPGLTPTDMAAIQQLQFTVLPAAVMPVNTAVTSTPTPSTIDMLSLFGSGVNEQDVSTLLSHFSEDAGNESNPDQQPSQGEGNNFSSFAQGLTRSNNATSAASTTATAGPNMSEVYDQLSDKMATEMAARMHKQLSDGEWKMKFALRPSNLGGVEIQLEMKDGKLDAVFRADNPLTRDLLQNSSQRLKEALGNFGINAGQVNVGQGGGNTQQNSSGNSNRNSQVRDNSSSQVSGTGSASGATPTRNKANASLLDLYA
jgi:flagellar hook-length control protein FliK